MGVQLLMWQYILRWDFLFLGEISLKVFKRLVIQSFLLGNFFLKYFKWAEPKHERERKNSFNIRAGLEVMKVKEKRNILSGLRPKFMQYSWNIRLFELEFKNLQKSFQLSTKNFQFRRSLRRVVELEGIF